jgi:hypothetical protein
MKAKEFDRKFDEGEDVTRYLDLRKTRRPVQEQKRVNVDFPVWMIQLLDKEANRLSGTLSMRKWPKTWPFPPKHNDPMSKVQGPSGLRRLQPQPDF